METRRNVMLLDCPNISNRFVDEYDVCVCSFSFHIVLIEFTSLHERQWHMLPEPERLLLVGRESNRLKYVF
jgi:hypothetical protein